MSSSRSSGFSVASSASRRTVKSSWIGIGFSHQSVPSLSKTATRASGSTKSGPGMAADEV
jgi:hypothetical protein